jgi:hypothetical protein
LLLQLLPLHLRLLRNLPTLPLTQRSVGARRPPRPAEPSLLARVRTTSKEGAGPKVR